MSNQERPWDDGPACGRDPHPEGEGRCYFHGEFEKDSDEFVAALREYEAGLAEGAALDCTRFVLPEFTWPWGQKPFIRPFYAYRATFLKKADFTEARFDGVVGFRQARFADQAIFANTEFGTSVDFRFADFTKYSTFENSKFGGDAKFWFTRFRGHADFQNSDFHNNVAFMETSFSHGADFRAGAFSGETSFHGAKFMGVADFRGREFSGGADFRESNFENAAWWRVQVLAPMKFWNSSFKARSDWTGTLVGPEAILEFRDCIITDELRLRDLSFPDMPASVRAATSGSTLPIAGRPDIRIDLRDIHMASNARVRIQGTRNAADPGRGRMDCSKILFAHADVSRIQFENVRWHGEPAFKPAKKDQIRVADEFYLTDGPGEKTNADFPSDSAEKIAPPIVANIYKGLRRSYENNLHYSEAGPFHIREMEMRRFILEKDVENATGREKRSASWHLWWLKAYRRMSNYGESYGRALAWIGALIAVAGGLQVLDGWLHEGPLSDTMAAASDSLPDWLGRGLTGLESAILNGTNALIPTQLGEVESLAGLLFGVAGIVLAAQVGIALRRNFRR